MMNNEQFIKVQLLGELEPFKKLFCLALVLEIDGKRNEDMKDSHKSEGLSESILGGSNYASRLCFGPYGGIFAYTPYKMHCMAISALPFE